MEIAEESVAVLCEYEATSVDILERIAAANRRQGEDVDLKVANALKTAQLDHLRKAGQDVRQRLRKAERQRDKAVATSHQLDKELALLRRMNAELMRDREQHGVLASRHSRLLSQHERVKANARAQKSGRERFAATARSAEAGA